MSDIGSKAKVKYPFGVEKESSCGVSGEWFSRGGSPSL